MTGTDAVEKLVCRSCYAVVDAGDNFCRRCGAPIGSAAVPRPSAQDDANRPVLAEVVEPRSVGRKWSDSPWIVLVLLFFVLGPLALPMLWRSRQFSLVWKLVLTAIVIGLTVLILWLIWYVLDKSLEPLRQLQNLPGF